MKKLLIATSALVATAGIAAAEVAVTGNGRMGVVYDGTDLNFSSRIRIVFTASGETDGGLSFGGTIRADNSVGGAAGSAGNVFIAGAFGRLEMGDVVGAAEKVVGNLPEIGYQDISGAENDLLYLTGDGAQTRAGNPVALYTYTTGGLTFALSLNDGHQPAVASMNGATGAITVAAANTTQEFGLGVKYAFGDYAVALGYESSDPAAGATQSQVILGASGTFGTTTVGLMYGDLKNHTTDKQLGLHVTSKFDAITVLAYIRKDDYVAGGDKTSYGLGAEYSLGGGATLAGGIADNDLPGSDARADFGIKFTF